MQDQTVLEKQAFAGNFLLAEADCLNFLNADLIARGISSFNPETVALEAGKIFLKRMGEFSKITYTI